MKKFKFRLEAVSRVRRIELEQQAKALALAVAALEQSKQNLLELEQLVEAEVFRVKELALQSNFAHPLFALSRAYREELKRKQFRKRKEIQEREIKVEQERLKLVEKEKRKKIIDKLEEKEREVYEQDFRKSEAKEMDEVVSMRWSYD